MTTFFGSDADRCHLLVGFDGSREAQCALQWSAAVAAGGRLTVVFVDAGPGWAWLGAAGVGFGGLSVLPLLAADDGVPTRMRRAISTLPADVSVTSFLRRGRVGVELARVAELTCAAAIVVGAESHHARRTARCVYSRVSRRANVPVIEIGCERDATCDPRVLRATDDPLLGSRVGTGLLGAVAC
jgi:Universal stress protein family